MGKGLGLPAVHSLHARWQASSYGPIAERRTEVMGGRSVGTNMCRFSHVPGQRTAKKLMAAASIQPSGQAVRPRA